MNPPPFVMRLTTTDFQPGQGAAAPSSQQQTQGYTNPVAARHENNNIGNDYEAHLLSQLRHQVEYYFSADNLRRDVHLQTLLSSRDHYGLVPLATIASFGRVREIYASHKLGQHVPARFATEPADPATVQRSLVGSERVLVSHDGHWLRPTSTAWIVGGNGEDGGARAFHHHHHHEHDQQQPPVNGGGGGDDHKNHGRPALSVSVETKATTTTGSSGSAATSPSITPTSFDSAEAAADGTAAGSSGFVRSDHHHPKLPTPNQPGESPATTAGPVPPSTDAVPSTVSVTPRRGNPGGAVTGPPTQPVAPHYPAPQPLSRAINNSQQLPYLPVPPAYHPAAPIMVAPYPNGMAFMYPPHHLHPPPPPSPPHAGGPPPQPHAGGPPPQPHAGGPPPAVPPPAMSPSPSSPVAHAHAPHPSPSGPAPPHAHSPPQQGYVVPFHVPFQCHHYQPQPQQQKQSPLQQNQGQQQHPQHRPQQQHHHPQHHHPQHHHPQQQHPQGFVAMADTAGAPTMGQQQQAQQVDGVPVARGEAGVPMFHPPTQPFYYHPNPSGPAPSTASASSDGQQSSTLRHSPTTTTTRNPHHPPVSGEAPFVVPPPYVQYPGGYVAAVPASAAANAAGQYFYPTHHLHQPYYPVDGPFVATTYGMAEGYNMGHEDSSYDPANYRYPDAPLRRSSKSDDSGSLGNPNRRCAAAAAPKGKHKNRDSGLKFAGSSNSAAGSVTSVTSRSTATTTGAEVVVSAGRSRPVSAVGGDNRVPPSKELPGCRKASGQVSQPTVPSAAPVEAAATTTTASPPRIHLSKEARRRRNARSKQGASNDSNINCNGDHATSSSTTNGGKKSDVGTVLTEEHFPALSSPRGTPGGPPKAEHLGELDKASVPTPRPSVPLPYAEAAKAKKRQDQPKQPKQQAKQNGAAAKSMPTPDDVTREMLGLSVED